MLAFYTLIAVSLIWAFLALYTDKTGFIWLSGLGVGALIPCIIDLIRDKGGVE